MEIDIRTLFFIFSAENIFIILFLCAYVLLYKVKIPIINIFIIGRLIYLCVFSFFALREIIPDFFSILLGNVFLFFAITYDIYCIAFAKQVFKRKLFIRLNLIPIFLSGLFLTFCTAEESIRVIVVSFIIASIYMGGGLYLFFIKSKTKIQRLVSYFCFGIFSIYFLRAFWVIFVDSSTQLYTSNFIQLTSYISLSLISFSWAIALLLILKEQDEEIIKNDNLKLQELNYSKGKFFSIISHDLRGPLGNLYKIGELLWVDHDEINEESRKSLTESLYLSAKTTFNLLDNLIKWASSNSGRMEYKPKQINIKDIINENLTIFKSIAELKNIKLDSSILDDLLVYADYEMINTVIRNLISNAIKFTHQSGQIKIIIKEDNNVFLIGVADNGVGMKKSTMSEILKLDSTIKTLGTADEMGTGLGLKLCKEFIEKNKGEIWIESQEKIGTTVWVSLPKIKILSSN